LKEISKKEGEMEELTKPKPIDYTKNKNIENNNNNYYHNNDEIIQKNKPIIDYNVKIKNLEKNNMLISQRYNETRCKNELLMKELNELRRDIQINLEKKKLLEENLEKNEKDFFEEKEGVEKLIKENQENTLKIKIANDQKELFKKNKQMVNTINQTDKDITSNLAKKKYLEHENKKLQEKEQKIIQKYENQLKNFYKENEKEIKKYENYDPTSKVIEMIDQNKFEKFEKILNTIYAETNLEDINDLIKYFIDCSKEVKIILIYSLKI
jgi:hypothetical protein